MCFNDPSSPRDAAIRYSCPVVATLERVWWRGEGEQSRWLMGCFLFQWSMTESSTTSAATTESSGLISRGSPRGRRWRRPSSGFTRISSASASTTRPSRSASTRSCRSTREGEGWQHQGVTPRAPGAISRSLTADPGGLSPRCCSRSAAPVCCDIGTGALWASPCPREHPQHSCSALWEHSLSWLCASAGKLS